MMSIALALILLVSTLQFSVYKMECLMSGNTQISLTDFGDCNKTTTGKNAISQRCCDFLEITLDFDYDTKINLNKVKTASHLVVLTKFNAVSFKPVYSNSNFNYYTNLPPPGGYELLKVIQVFRI